MQNNLGNNLKFLRKKTNKTQTQLAFEVGKKQSGYASWERGQSEPGIKELIAITEIFGITLDELILTDLEETGYTPYKKSATATTSDTTETYTGITGMELKNALSKYNITPGAFASFLGISRQNMNTRFASNNISTGLLAKAAEMLRMEAPDLWRSIKGVNPYKAPAGITILNELGSMEQRYIQLLEENAALMKKLMDTQKEVK